jgi:SAM-dependent methyltransferase
MMDTGHRPLLDGTVKVVRFNWPKYVAVLLIVAAASAWTASNLYVTGSFLLWGVAAAAAILTSTSLAATWWVYDHKRIYDLVCIGLGSVGSYAAVHAGFDDASPHLERSIGYEPVAVVDLQVTPRGSLRRARIEPLSRRAGIRSLPFESGSLDTIFMTFAAHEVRPLPDQRALFAELQRVLGSGGRLVVTEHMLDRATVAVYGPGALHFQPAMTWMRRAREQRFDLVKDDRLTPFVRRLVWQH